MMRSELRLQNLYNRFRVSNGLPAVEFESVHLLPTRDVKVNMCFVCHFDAFADIHDEYQTIKEQSKDTYNGGIFSSLGANTHYVRDFGDKETMMDTKRKFPVKTALHGHQFRAGRRFDWDE